MHERIHHGANLLKNPVFQFDFLNDDFSKLPQSLQDIINNLAKRQKLVIYINPPYKRGLGVVNTKWHKEEIGAAKDELFTQFIYRIYSEIYNSKIVEFSKLKILQAPNFINFRKVFRAKLEKMFLAPANTFDNIKGQFPIAFKIWDLAIKTNLTNNTKIKVKVFNHKKENIQTKNFYIKTKKSRITEWINQFNIKNTDAHIMGYTGNNGPDFQNNIYCHLSSHQKINTNNTLNNATKYRITQKKFIYFVIYFAVRKVIPLTWLNDRASFCFPMMAGRRIKNFKIIAWRLLYFMDKIELPVQKVSIIGFRLPKLKSMPKTNLPVIL